MKSAQMLPHWRIVYDVNDGHAHGQMTRKASACRYPLCHTLAIAHRAHLS